MGMYYADLISHTKSVIMQDFQGSSPLRCLVATADVLACSFLMYTHLNWDMPDKMEVLHMHIFFIILRESFRIKMWSRFPKPQRIVVAEGC